MTNIATSGDGIVEEAGFQQRDIIHALQPYLERRVMHEDDHGLIARFLKCLLQPGSARRAKGTPGLARFVGVQADAQYAFTHLEGELHESVGVESGLRKGRAEVGAIVVVTYEQMIGDHELVELALQRFVSLGLAFMSQVPGDDGKGSVGVAVVHVGDAERQAVQGIEPVQQVSRWNEVSVRDVDEFLHWLLLHPDNDLRRTWCATSRPLGPLPSA